LKRTPSFFNNRGSLTVDFLFAFFLVAGFSLVIMTFSATLSTVEVVQYMTYSAARNYFAGNVNEPRQKQLAAAKFAELKQSRVIAPLLNGGWFEVPDEKIIIDFNIPAKYQEFQEYAEGQAPERNLFHGVIVLLNAKILSFQVPFFGSTQKGGNKKNRGSGFSTYITAFLGREPTFEECSEVFNEERWKKIKKLPNNRGASTYDQAKSSDSDYVVMNDNGC
jgi:hypothetical protein